MATITVTTDSATKALANRVGAAVANRCGCGSAECREIWGSDAYVVLRVLQELGFTIQAPPSAAPTEPPS